MTLVVSWTRTTKHGRELWMMSDSRLSGGMFWDYGPKIFGIGRSDAVIGFAGDTAWTYPLIAQITSYVESFVNLRERVIDISEAYSQILEMLNESRSFVSKPAHPEMTIPECSFILAGYSARRRDFFIRKIGFHRGRKQFEGTLPKSYAGESVALIGDKGPIDATVRRVSEQLKNARTKRPRLDKIPAEAFFEVLTSNRFTEIGGAPQLVKVYDHMNQRHFGVYWPHDVPHEEQHIYLRGRRLKPYDALDHPWVYEPSTASLFWQDFSPDQRRTTTSERESAEKAKAEGWQITSG